MNPILLDFEKLFATIKNDKNNLSHLPQFGEWCGCLRKNIRIIISSRSNF